MTFIVQLQDKPARRDFTVQPGDHVFCGMYHGHVVRIIGGKVKVKVTRSNHGDWVNLIAAHNLTFQSASTGGAVNWTTPHLGVRE